jgi:hypothetical protein
MPKGKRFDADAALKAYFRAELSRERAADGSTPEHERETTDRPARGEVTDRRAWLWEAAAAAALLALAVLPAWRSSPRLGMPILEAAANGKLSSLTRPLVQDLRSVAAAAYGEAEGARSGELRNYFFDRGTNK